MTIAAFALQKAVRAALVNSPAVSALVPASAIMDKGARPEVFPAIVFGLADTIAEDLTLNRNHFRVVLALHVWCREEGREQLYAILQAIQEALTQGIEIDDFQLVDLPPASVRASHGASGDYSHGLVTVEALLEKRP
ncbi:DUF3168 domain-containing protein [Mongoliimonas terrestris]|uniref:DUF3168 domain-containing protein n=1 Tax=Mongoliimonas terrestris TaxID=1709001 RepID=UPI000A6D972A|nr:DUF3168 domain-containing protein [Mongoliimonas terrestris]